MINEFHPYKLLSSKSFWKTGVADLEPLKIDLNWQPKFLIDSSTKIITVGSCFAQNISKYLQRNGFSWLDSEPAPINLAPKDHNKNGYGLFSFRTGNIYTPAMLRQWVKWSTCQKEQSQEYFKNDERFFDPFRPTLTEEGFDTYESMLAARNFTLSAILKTIMEADLFIFTLGLTETWRNKDGTVYPICPGTARGQFIATDHLFHNYSVNEILHDLNCTFDELIKINPKLRFMLTVSPVPLTATASGQHVLISTTYSKSILRAAAGDLFFNRSDTDYFPSYELITAPAFKGQFFELNQRQVTSQGVAFVMRQFFNGYGISDENSDETLSVKKIKKNTSTQITGDVIATEVCDEIILESWRNNPVDELSTPKNILLIGDSHMGMLSNILTKSGITHAGGATMNASEWHAMKFTVDDDIIFKPNNAEQLSNWEAAFNSMGGKSSYNLSRRPVCLTNLGIQRNEAWFRGFIGEHLKNIYGTNIPPQIQVADLKNYILSARINHIGLICRLLAMNYQVIVVSDPPVESPDDTSACSMTDSLLLDLYKSVGCQIFNARDWINEIGGLPEKYRSTDAMHGSEIYYRDLQMVLFHKFLIKNK